MSGPSIPESDFVEIIRGIIRKANIKLAEKHEIMAASIRGEFARHAEQMTISLSENGKFTEENFAKAHIHNRDAIPVIQNYLDIFLQEFNEQSSGEKFKGGVLVASDGREGCHKRYYRFKFTPIGS